MGAAVGAGVTLRGSLLRQSRSLVLAVVLPLLILGFWTLSSIYNIFGPGLSPTPLESADAYQQWVVGKPRGLVDPFNGTWAQNIAASSVRVAIGVTAAALVGIFLGILIGRESHGRTAD